MSTFYFTTQTGLIQEEKPEAPSNFWRYEIHDQHRARVEAAVDAASVGSAGLEYPPGFLQWLEQVDLGEGGAP